MLSLGQQHSGHLSTPWMTETCFVFQAEMVGCSMGLVKCRVSTVLTLSAEQFVKAILLDLSYITLSTPARGTKASIV